MSKMPEARVSNVVLTKPQGATTGIFNPEPTPAVKRGRGRPFPSKGGEIVNIGKTRTQEIVRLHGEVVGHLRQSLEKAIRIGQLLSEQKGAGRERLDQALRPKAKPGNPFTLVQGQ